MTGCQPTGSIDWMTTHWKTSYSTDCLGSMNSDCCWMTICWIDCWRMTTNSAGRCRIALQTGTDRGSCRVRHRCRVQCNRRRPPRRFHSRPSCTRRHRSGWRRTNCPTMRPMMNWPNCRTNWIGCWTDSTDCCSTGWTTNRHTSRSGLRPQTDRGTYRTRCKRRAMCNRRWSIGHSASTKCTRRHRSDCCWTMTRCWRMTGWTTRTNWTDWTRTGWNSCCGWCCWMTCCWATQTAWGTRAQRTQCRA